MPKDFQVGQTADVRINAEPARVTWRDRETLVIEPDDPRRILSVDRAGDLLRFVCADRGNQSRLRRIDGEAGDILILEDPPSPPRKFKVLVLVDCFGTQHHDAVRRQGYDPAWAYQCMEVDFPAGREVPDDLLEAVQFAREASLNDTGVIVLEPNGLTSKGRRPIVSSFPGTYQGKPCEFRYFVGFTAPVLPAVNDKETHAGLR
jgi:hypothetical protein